MPEIITGSAEETEYAGKCLGKLARPGDIYCLYGDLGAGKTCFARGVAEGLEVKEHITSPTFIIIHEYTGKIPLYHMDVYRLESSEDMEELGYEEYFYGDGVTLLEWAERIEDILPENRLEIYITGSAEDENTRKIRLVGKGERFERLAGEMSRYVHSGN